MYTGDKAGEIAITAHPWPSLSDANTPPGGRNDNLSIQRTIPISSKHLADTTATGLVQTLVIPDQFYFTQINFHRNQSILCGVYPRSSKFKYHLTLSKKIRTYLDHWCKAISRLIKRFNGLKLCDDIGAHLSEVFLTFVNIDSHPHPSHAYRKTLAWTRPVLLQVNKWTYRLIIRAIFSHTQMVH
jgi:hypothetical protein